jgi:hypothetical protein
MKPLPQTISERVRNMTRKSDVFFEDAIAESVRSIVCRIADESDREYRVAKENGGVRVWRIR